MKPRRKMIYQRIRFCFLLVCLLTIGDISSNGQQLGFLKYFYFNNTLSYAEDLIVTQDSALVLTGKAWKPSHLGNYYILKCDLDGDTIWYREGTLYDPLNPFSTSDNFGYFVKELQNGSYVVGGIIEGTVLSMYIIGYSQSGIKEFEKTYSISGYSFYPETMTQIDSSLFFFGRKCDSVCADVFFKTTLKGDSLSLIESNNYNIGFHPKASVKNSLFDIITAGNNFDSILGINQPSLKIIDTTGIISDEYVFPGTVDDIALSVQWTIDSMLLITTNEGKLVKAEPTGAEIWSIQLPGFNDFCETIIVNAHQYLIITEFITFTWIDSAGVQLDYNNYYPGFNGYNSGAIVLNDKIYITGSDQNPGPPLSSSTFLMQILDSNLTNTNNLSLYNSDYIFPNIISDRNECHFKIETTKRLKSVSMYNNLGTIVSTNELCANCTEFYIDCNKIYPGHYIMKISYHNGDYSFHKILLVQ